MLNLKVIHTHRKNKTQEGQREVIFVCENMEEVRLRPPLSFSHQLLMAEKRKPTITVS